MSDELSSLLDTAFWLTAGAIVLLLALSAFFSGSETALTAASRAKLRARADKGDVGAEAALEVTEDSERLIGAILLGNNVVNILSASLATALLTRLFGDSGVALATLGMTLLVLIRITSYNVCYTKLLRARVRRMSRGRRSIRDRPNSVSSSRICMDSAGWVTCTASAAREKLRCRSSAIR